METLHVMVREAVGQIPPQRLLRDEDREAIRRHQERLLALGPEVAQGLEEVLYSRLPESAEPSREDLERWWGRTVTGSWDDDYLVWMAFIGLVHVTNHVVQLVVDALVRFEIPEEERWALLDAVGRLAGTVRVVIAWSHERAVSTALYEAAGMPEGLLARLRDQEVGAFLGRARAELNL